QPVWQLPATFLSHGHPTGLVPVVSRFGNYMQPLYTPHNIKPAYQLNWGATIFWRNMPIDESHWLAELKKSTEPDGVRVLKHQWTTNNASQFFLSTTPIVAPSAMLRSIKGRLQNVVQAQAPKALRRNYSLRSVGAATRSMVESYVAGQYDHHPMADPQVQERLMSFQRDYPGVNLATACFSAHGQFWYNLHVVLVNQRRWMEIRQDVLDTLGQMIDRVAAKYECRLSRVALLPDHMHMTMGCRIDRSPEEIALAYLNNLAFACGMKTVFQPGYYVGTIGEYDRGAV
ncbi:MAG: transposase, partial [Pirellulales bacterium]|nr:transposase [Pirellulales bacterium]